MAPIIRLWYAISRRTDAEAEAPVLWPLDSKNSLIGKTLMLGKIEGGEGTTEDGITDSMTRV